MEVPSDQRRQFLHVLRRFLHEKDVGPLPVRKRSHVADGGTGQAEQIPAYDPHAGLTASAVCRAWRGGSGRSSTPYLRQPPEARF